MAISRRAASIKFKCSDDDDERCFAACEEEKFENSIFQLICDEISG